MIGRLRTPRSLWTGTAKGNAVPWGEVEAARSVSVPPDAPAAPPLPTHAGLSRGRWHLTRLARRLRRYDWTTELRIDGPHPMLRVYADNAPTIGESVSVVWGNGAWWYQSSTGIWLTRCTRPRLAADKVTVLLTPWVALATTRYSDE